MSAAKVEKAAIKSSRGREGCDWEKQRLRRLIQRAAEVEKAAIESSRGGDGFPHEPQVLLSFKRKQFCSKGSCLLPPPNVEIEDRARGEGARDSW